MPKLDKFNSSLSSTPFSKNISTIHKDLLQKNALSKTLLDEYTNTFSSNKTPMNANSRTLSSISMDIINQRVENINRNVSLNRSISESNVSYEKIEESIKQLDTPAQVKANGAQSKQPVTEEHNTTPAAIVRKPNKRKLFAPPSMFNEIMTASKTDNETVLQSVPEVATKRGREDDMVSNLYKPNDKRAKKNGTKGDVVGDVNTVKKASRRRSSIFFQSAKKPTKTQNDGSLRPVQSISTPKSVMVFTNMHQPQIDFIKEVRQSSIA